MKIEKFINHILSIFNTKKNAKLRTIIKEEINKHPQEISEEAVRGRCRRAIEKTDKHELFERENKKIIIKKKEIIHPKKEYKLKQLENKVRKLEKQFYNIEDIYEKFAECIKVRPTPKFKIRKVSKGKQTMIINLGDSHIGKKVEERITGGLSIFDSKIFKEQLEYYLSTILDKFKLHNKNKPIEKVIIHFLGDMIDNDSIYFGHNNYVEMESIEQVVFAHAVFAEFIDELYQKLRIPIELKCVYGNHGRRGKRGQYRNHANFDYLLYKNLQREFRNYQNLIFDVPVEWFCIYKLYNKNMLVFHGDEIKSGKTIVGGVDRVTKAYSQMMRKFFAITFMGHFHQGIECGLGTDDLIVNGSFDGGDLFSIRTLRTMSKSSQTIIGVDERGIIDWTYKVVLPSH